LFISNIDLHKDLIEELAFDPSIDERNIAVAVNNDGVVTLTGTVPNYAQKLAAERATKRVRGVKGIAEQLTIDLPAFHERNDADLVFSAMQALRWNANIPNDAVFVTAENGRLTLTGTIEWQYQREAAALAVASIPGVRHVKNDVALRKHVAVSDVKEKIQDSFRRSAEIDATRIVVEAAGGTVTLRGSVHSWAERADASVAAYSIAGVSDVKNLTTLS
jgi:osmotically-inducible protein OsmY